MFRKRSRTKFLVISSLVLAWALTFYTPAQSQSLDRSSTSPRNLKVFDAVWSAINNRYFDPKFNGSDWGRMREVYRPQAEAAVSEPALYDLLNRMLGVLHDPHTWAQSPTDARREKMHESIDLGFTGKIISNQLIMTHIRRGSSAYKAGIQPGWILTRWGETAVNVSRLSGFALGDGQTVQLTFLDAEGRERRVEMVAQPFIDEPEQNARLLDRGILYIRFESFYVRGIGKWLSERLAQNAGAPACVVDLRGNWGGHLTELTEALEPFFASTTELGVFIERKGPGQPLRVSGRGNKAYKGKVLVLIDEGSFSAAELFAAAIQETRRGKIVGRESSGSALNNAQEVLPDGGLLNLSVRDYLTRTGYRIDGRGVKPDLLVTLSLEDLRLNIDRDLEHALRLAQ